MTSKAVDASIRVITFDLPAGITAKYLPVNRRMDFGAWSKRGPPNLVIPTAAGETTNMNKISAYLQANQPRFVQELCDYVRFPSVSAQPAHKKDLKACGEWLVKNCRQIGLQARLCATAGNPIIVAKTPRSKKSAKPHFVIYGHYDVQPPEPFELWKSPPFEPRIVGRSMFGRGASDNKGQNLAHLKAVEAYLKTGTELPCDLTFVIEGEEEVGSANLETFLEKNIAELKCDAVVVSDTGIPSPKHPALTYGLRGI